MKNKRYLQSLIFAMINGLKGDEQDKRLLDISSKYKAVFGIINQLASNGEIVYSTSKAYVINGSDYFKKYITIRSKILDIVTKTQRRPYQSQQHEINLLKEEHGTSLVSYHLETMTDERIFIHDESKKTYSIFADFDSRDLPLTSCPRSLYQMTLDEIKDNILDIIGSIKEPSSQKEELDRFAVYSGIDLTDSLAGLFANEDIEYIGCTPLHGYRIPKPPLFKEGDLVYLKSGGPMMTVSMVGLDCGISIATCDWFNGNVFNERQFHPDTLVKHEPIKSEEGWITKTAETEIETGDSALMDMMHDENCRCLMCNTWKNADFGKATTYLHRPKTWQDNISKPQKEQDSNRKL